jgi:hypothetical protein
VIQPPQRGAHHQVQAPEVGAKERRREDHDDGRGVDLLVARPGHALHLRPDFREEVGETRPPALRLAQDAATTPLRRDLTGLEGHLFDVIHAGRLHVVFRMQAMAGQEGLEPPTPGFGDRCSTN